MTYQIVTSRDDGLPRIVEEHDSHEDAKDAIRALALREFIADPAGRRVREMDSIACQYVYRVGNGRGRPRSWVLLWIQCVLPHPTPAGGIGGGGGRG